MIGQEQYIHTSNSFKRQKALSNKAQFSLFDGRRQLSINPKRYIPFPIQSIAYRDKSNPILNGVNQLYSKVQANGLHKISVRMISPASVQPYTVSFFLCSSFKCFHFFKILFSESRINTASFTLSKYFFFGDASDIPSGHSPFATSPYKASNLLDVLVRMPCISTLRPIRALTKGFAFSFLMSFEPSD
ncbi:hypothetical protein C2G38_83820 [Gigaspora rosea]|uniref:Uncharacterized protein n=1 Tax=Gigaspora rosea TaxID=44941 RepID=A0A397VYS4_9GLOM|nr:hypothetical protein C2G38_83820 [Gigaspora rosea]